MADKSSKHGFSVKAGAFAAVLAALLILTVVAVTPERVDANVKVKIGGKTFHAKFNNSKTAKALIKRFPKTYTMEELNGNEKYKDLSYDLPANEKPVKKIKAGDIMLYGSDCLVLFYKSFKTSYEYTRIGRLTSTRGLAKAVGKKSVKVRFSKSKAPYLNKTKLDLTVGESAKIKLCNAKAGKVRWKSLKKSVATVTKGTIKARKPGKVKIRASYKKKNYYCTVTVKAKKSAGQDQTVSNGGSQNPGGEAPKAKEAAPGIDQSAKTLKLTIDGKELDVEWKDNESVAKLKELATGKPLVIDMSRYGGFEQVGPIGTSIPRSDVQTSTSPGDIVLYSGNQIVVFYGTNSWSYTRLGKIKGMDKDALKALLGEKDVVLKLSME